MIIKEIKYKPFNVKLTHPFRTSIGEISERTGFYLSIEDELGNKGIGEISPLPGFSKESYNDIEKELHYLCNFICEKEFDINSIDEIQFGGMNSLVPSIQFGLEQSLINLLLQRNNSRLNSLNGDVIKERIEVNSLIDMAEKDEVLEKVFHSVNSGYNTIKLKIGRKNFFDDLRLIDLIRNKVPDKIQLRLDSNGAWDIDNAYDYLNKLSIYNIQYIEDPCKHTDCLIKLSSVSPIPIALDLAVNSLNELSKHISSGVFRFLIVKPMLLGSITKLISLIKTAESKKINIIISSAFETPLGKSMLCFLAALTKHNYAHGLATSEYFADEMINNPFLVMNGSITFNKNLFPPKFDISL